MVSSTAIADTIRSRTEELLRKTGAAVSSKPIVMRAEYAHCPNLTIIDTPGFILKVLNQIWLFIMQMLVLQFGCYTSEIAMKTGKEG